MIILGYWMESDNFTKLPTSPILLLLAGKRQTYRFQRRNLLFYQRPALWVTSDWAELWVEMKNRGLKIGWIPAGWAY